MMRIANTVVVCLLLIVCLLLSVSASAGIIERHLYTPTSLPSAQGWTYQTNGLDEEAVFELVSDVLVMDTMGDGLDGAVAVILTGDSPNGITDAFAFGDTGRHANARVEITEIELTTFDGAPVAVEQTSFSAIRSLFGE